VFGRAARFANTWRPAGAPVVLLYVGYTACADRMQNDLDWPSCLGVVPAAASPFVAFHFAG